MLRKATLVLCAVLVMAGSVLTLNRVLKGARPSPLPVQAPTQYELIINHKTAKALGPTTPDIPVAPTDVRFQG